MNLFTATAKSFSSARGPQKFCLDGDDLTVWDSVAEHYTSCHAMSSRVVARLKRLGRAS